MLIEEAHEKLGLTSSKMLFFESLIKAKDSVDPNE